MPTYLFVARTTLAQLQKTRKREISRSSHPTKVVASAGLCVLAYRIVIKISNSVKDRALVAVIGQPLTKMAVFVILGELLSETGSRRVHFNQSKNGKTVSAKHIPHPSIDLETMKEAVRMILIAIGEDPDRPGLLETPRRVAHMYAEMFSGLKLEPTRHLAVTFPEEYDEMVLVRDITFTSMCEHHLLPFSGVAHVAYIPDGKVTGLSKIARVVEEVSRRPQVQERMTSTIAEMVNDHLKTKGVAVVVSAEHTCMAIRGIRKPGSQTVTSALRGEFKDNQSTRAEFMSLISKNK